MLPFHVHYWSFVPGTKSKHVNSIFIKGNEVIVFADESGRDMALPQLEALVSEHDALVDHPRGDIQDHDGVGVDVDGLVAYANLFEP